MAPLENFCFAFFAVKAYGCYGILKPRKKTKATLLHRRSIIIGGAREKEGQDH